MKYYQGVMLFNSFPHIDSAPILINYNLFICIVCTYKRMITVINS
jgi:hypothetical protein